MSDGYDSLTAAVGAHDVRYREACRGRTNLIVLFRPGGKFLRYGLDVAAKRVPRVVE